MAAASVAYQRLPAKHSIQESSTVLPDSGPFAPLDLPCPCPYLFAQYTSLVHFLASGHYQNPYDDGRRSVSNVDHWGHNYERLYSGVTRKVTDALGSR